MPAKFLHPVVVAPWDIGERSTIRQDKMHSDGHCVATNASSTLCAITDMIAEHAKPPLEMRSPARKEGKEREKKKEVRIMK